MKWEGTYVSTIRCQLSWQVWLNIASWDALISGSSQWVAAPRRAERPWRGSRSYVRVTQRHRGLAAKFLTALALPGAAMPDLSLLTATGMLSILSPQCRPCCWYGDAL